MTAEERARKIEGIKTARDALQKGLILDPEAASQLRRMIWYAEDELEKDTEDKEHE